VALTKLTGLSKEVPGKTGPADKQDGNDHTQAHRPQHTEYRQTGRQSLTVNRTTGHTDPLPPPEASISSHRQSGANYDACQKVNDQRQRRHKLQSVHTERKLRLETQHQNLDENTTGLPSV